MLLWVQEGVWLLKSMTCIDISTASLHIGAIDAASKSAVVDKSFKRQEAYHIIGFTHVLMEKK